jgi:hypothetical protein
VNNLLPKSCLAVAIVVAACPAQAGQTPAPAPKAPGAPATTTNTAVIPQSVFLVPRVKEEGRDPFFPASVRVYGTATITPSVTNVQPVFNLDIRLKGFSGPLDHRLAIINNHTFEVGEEGDVLSGNVRMRIRCLEIRTDSVIVQIGAERKELRLRPGL